MLKTNATNQEKKKARIAHEVFTFNAIVVHLFIPVAIMKFGNSQYALAIPIFISLAIIFYTYYKTNKVFATKNSYYLYIHWRWSLNWYKPVLIAYGVSISIVLIGQLISLNSDTNMADIINTVFLRIAIAPTFIVILIAFVVISGAMFNSGRGEIPEKLAKKYPEDKFNN